MQHSSNKHNSGIIESDTKQHSTLYKNLLSNYVQQKTNVETAGDFTNYEDYDSFSNKIKSLNGKWKVVTLFSILKSEFFI